MEMNNVLYPLMRNEKSIPLSPIMGRERPLAFFNE